MALRQSHKKQRLKSGRNEAISFKYAPCITKGQSFFIKEEVQWRFESCFCFLSTQKQVCLHFMCKSYFLNAQNDEKHWRKCDISKIHHGKNDFIPISEIYIRILFQSLSSIQWRRLYLDVSCILSIRSVHTRMEMIYMTCKGVNAPRFRNRGCMWSMNTLFT